MKLIVIGRNAQECNIVLASDYVSNYHAEIIQLDNGDMFIVDKSANGTYLNGSRLVPGKETQIRRGDSIYLADVPLDWSLIQDVVLPGNIKQIKNIGSHYMNAINIQGPNVSRFHATMRQTSDGKWYICDHSKNGTTVNGRRIPRDQYVLLKKGDEISCAGVPVVNPVTHPKIAKIFAIGAAAVCVLVACAIALSKIIQPQYTDQELCVKYENSVGMLVSFYHFEVECGLLDIAKLPDPDSYSSKKGSFTRNLYDTFVVNDGTISEFDGSNSLIAFGTGFFIGKDGYIATNRHVSRPWESESLSFGTRTITIEAAAEEYFREKLNKLYEMGYTPAFQYISQIKVKGVLDELKFIPNNEYFDEKNAYNCHEIVCGENEEEDLAIVKIRSNTLPHNSTYVPLDRVKPQTPFKGLHVMTIGFPFGLAMQDVSKTEIHANYAGGEISRDDFPYSFGFTAVSYHGASGSPVFDNKGYLIGVLNSGIDISQGFNKAIRSEYLENLILKGGIK